jgi:hypothetical protein
MASYRYALTLRLMLANLRKHKAGSQGVVIHATGSEAVLQSVPSRPANVVAQFPPDPTLLASMDELGMNWSAHINQSQINPATMPVWLQEGVSEFSSMLELITSYSNFLTQNFTDLGLPPDGFEGVFFPGPITGWPTELEPMPEAW